MKNDAFTHSPFAHLESAQTFFESDDLPAPIDWKDFYGVDEEPIVELEIGCGNGRYLRRAAEERPNHLFLGIERAPSYARKANERMVKYGIGTGRLVRADAVQFLESHIADSSVHDLHVYFTDPWPKKRHAKRRLFQPAFLETIHRILRPGGRVFIKIDLFWYFEEILGRFETSPHFNVVATGQEHDRNRDLYEVTGFEQKALEKKGQIFYIVAAH